MMFRILRILAALLLFVGVSVGHSANKLSHTAVDEIRLWKSDPGLQRLAKGLNPLKEPLGDGALGLNRRFPEKIQVSHQAEGWNWIRAGVALGNGFIIDRGIMAFEWAFARMSDDGSFGESKTVEISHFLGLYARSVLLLRKAKQDARAERLARLVPRLEISLRSSRSLLGEQRWNGEELRSWATHQRVQAAVAAYWIGRLLVNPGLKKTSDIWLEEALKRQEAIGLFPSGFPASSNSAFSAQLEILEGLQGLALQDAYYATKLQRPLQNGFRWLEKASPKAKTTLGIVGLVTFASYAAWTGDPYSTKLVAMRLKSIKL